MSTSLDLSQSILFLGSYGVLNALKQQIQPPFLFPKIIILNDFKPTTISSRPILTNDLFFEKIKPILDQYFDFLNIKEQFNVAKTLFPLINKTLWNEVLFCDNFLEHKKNDGIFFLIFDRFLKDLKSGDYVTEISFFQKIIDDIFLQKKEFFHFGLCKKNPLHHYILKKTNIFDFTQKVQLSPPVLRSPRFFSFLEHPTLFHEINSLFKVIDHFINQENRQVCIFMPNQKLKDLLYMKLKNLGQNIEFDIVSDFLKTFFNYVKKPTGRTLLSFIHHPLFKSQDENFLTKLQEKLQELELFFQKRGKKISDLDSFEFLKIDPLTKGSIADHQETLEKCLSGFFEFFLPKLNSQKNCKLKFKVMEQFFEITKNFSWMTCICPLFDYVFLLMDKITPTFSFQEGMNPKSKLRLIDEDNLRFESFDVLICAGLNEEHFPGVVSHLPWLSDSQKEALHLETQADFIFDKEEILKSGIEKSQNIIFSRSLREGNDFIQASRYWFFFEKNKHQDPSLKKILTSNILNFDDFKSININELQANQGELLIDDDLACPDIRPTTYSITDIERLVNDPYGFYVKRILKLIPLDEVDIDFSGLDFGILVHKVLFSSLKDHSFFVKENRLSILKYHENIVFKPFFSKDPLFELFWKPKLDRFFEWFIEQEVIQTSLLETKDMLTLSLTNKISITGIPDRIDRDMKTAKIIDYKTGALFPLSEITQGFRPQLLIEAFMLSQGCFFRKNDSNFINSFDNLSISVHIFHMNTKGGEILSLDLTLSDLKKIEDNLFFLLTHYLNSKNPFLIKNNSKLFDPYKHLKRIL